MDSPADIPAGSVVPSMDVRLGGSDKGTVHVAGPANHDGHQVGRAIVIPDLTGTYKPGASGKTTLSPGVLTVKALGTTTTCIPRRSRNVAVSLQLDTSAQPGGASGGTSTGGTTGGTATGGSGGSTSTSGGLAETGASDNGGLRALGLVAGTVILLGGAVFTFTPWRSLRGTR